jgi:hypothetical protein
MAAPNMANVTTMYGTTAVLAASTTLANVMVNAAASGNVFKVNVISVSNYSNAAITSNVVIQRSSVNYYLAGNISVPANSTLVVTGKDTMFYMIEADQLMANVSANTSVSVTASYEIIY